MQLLIYTNTFLLGHHFDFGYISNHTQQWPHNLCSSLPTISSIAHWRLQNFLQTLNRFHGISILTWWIPYSSSMHAALCYRDWNCHPEISPTDTQSWWLSLCCTSFLLTHSKKHTTMCHSTKPINTYHTGKDRCIRISSADTLPTGLHLWSQDHALTPPQLTFAVSCPCSDTT